MHVEPVARDAHDAPLRHLLSMQLIAAAFNKISLKDKYQTTIALIGLLLVINGTIKLNAPVNFIQHVNY